MTRTRPVTSTKQMIPSIRHQGYHTPYALAEIIDNAIQAKAKNIEVLCMDKTNIDTGTTQLQKIGIIDDGNGMNHNELWNSIRLGESQNRGKGGIGRFGVGLTHASFSQCTRIDVYSWQNNNVLHIHLDLNSLDDSDSISVEEPIETIIPDNWKNMSKYISKSGTLVVWTNLDKCRWKKASTLINNSHQLIGRLYRKYIERENLKIRLTSFDIETKTINIDKNVLLNDPLYLTAPSLTPKPWNNTPMFQKDGKRWEVRTPVKGDDGKMYDVITRYSFVKKDARAGGRQAGSKLHGKHAADNVGLSVIRAGRELTLDTNLLTSYDPVERWWGAEIEFPPALDELFGVSANKQTAPELSYMTQQIGKQSRDQKGRKDLIDEEDNPLYKIVNEITTRIISLRANVDRQKPPKSGSEDGEEPPFPEPKPDGPTVTSRQKDEMSEKQRRDEIEKFIKRHGLDSDEKWPLDQELRFEYATINGSQFFDIDFVSGIVVITINTAHPAYKYLLAMLLAKDDIDHTQAIKLLKKCSEGFKKFLASWARLENQTPSQKDRIDIGDIRHDWGKVLRDYFETDED